MRNTIIASVLVITFSCGERSFETNPGEDISYEQVSNQSDILFDEAEALFSAGSRFESAQKIYAGVEALKSELRTTSGLTRQRIDSIAFFLNGLGQKLEDKTAEVTEVQLVSVLYKVQLMTAHDYLVFSAKHLDNGELDSAQVSIVHATSKMISSINKAEGHPKTTLQVIHSETETLLNNLENKFQVYMAKRRHRLEKLSRRVKELENHILEE